MVDEKWGHGWLPGMHDTKGNLYTASGRWIDPRGEGIGYGNITGAYPGTDACTLGGLLRLARNAWADETLHLAPGECLTSKGWAVTGGEDSPNDYHYDTPTLPDEYFPTEFEALKAALDARCKHPEIVAYRTHPDGSIDGRCTSCGDDSFPIRDVPYEKWRDEMLDEQQPPLDAKGNSSCARCDNGGNLSAHYPDAPPKCKHCGRTEYTGYPEPSPE